MFTISMNNIDLAQIEAFVEIIKKNPKKAHFTPGAEGTWQYKEGGPRFSSDIYTKKGVVTFSMTHPTFIGPGPYPCSIRYVLFFISGCSCSTFMSAAEEKKSVFLR